MRTKINGLLGAGFLLFALSGCATGAEDAHLSASGAGSSPPSSNTAASYSITDFAGRSITFNQVPERIAALSSGDMDVIYALGGQLVGRPAVEGGPVPEAAEQVEQIGTTHELDLEKIAYVKPDVVLGNAALNAKDTATVESLGSRMVLTSANSVADIKQQIELFGNMLHKEAEATKLIETLNGKLATLSQQVPANKPRVLMVYGAPGTYMAALPNSLSGDLLSLAGGANIAADFPQLENYPQYAQLNTERIIEADPEFVLIITHGNPEAVKSGFLKEMQVNAAWNRMSAIQSGRVEVLPSDLFGTNPGTRVTEALDVLGSILRDVR
ncbi:ABC transporter substrate-binding protein [Paenibacillus massiliensis]|uniref:ABC transporter substrate-binding protein n=1 Tax=Paenibacillus massiliensis TaxID=225917 RepID=UPI000472170C|nr:ABC transporter substrate-binding protein [Paenibacillus massiliensis]